MSLKYEPWRWQTLIVVLGLLNTANAMSDPFGHDACDFNPEMITHGIYNGAPPPPGKVAVFLKLLAFLESTNTHPFASCFVVIKDVTPDGIRVVRSVLGAMTSLPIAAFQE